MNVLTLCLNKFGQSREPSAMDWTVEFVSIACTVMLNRSVVSGCPISIGRKQFSSCSMDPLHSLISALEPSSWTDEFVHRFDP